MGFTLENTALIITGALGRFIGRDPFLHHGKGMNRSFVSVIMGGFGGEVAAGGGGKTETRPVKQGSAEDAAFIMKNAGSVIILCRATAWRWHRRSMPCARWRTFLKKKA